MLILFLKATQQSLFDTPVMVQGSVRKEGSVVRPHVRIQKKKQPEFGKKIQGVLFDIPLESSNKQSRLTTFIAKQGGIDALAEKLATLNKNQQEVILKRMASLDGIAIREIRELIFPNQPAVKNQSPD